MLDMPRGRPPLPPEARKPRVSGKVRPPTPEEAARQRELVERLAAEVGEEMWQRGLAARASAPRAMLARIIGHRTGETLRLATLPHDAPLARYVRPETLASWEQAVQAWVAAKPAQG